MNIQCDLVKHHSDALHEKTLLNRLPLPRRMADLASIVIAVAVGIFASYQTFLLVSPILAFSTSLIIASAAGWGALSLLWIISQIGTGILYATKSKS